MRLPFRRAESKSYDVLPSGLWDQLQAFQDNNALIGVEQAVGLPALLAVIRLISHAAGLVPLNVVTGEEGEVRTRATDTWQWRLLHKRPGPPPTTPFNFKADVAASFCGRGSSYVRKIKPANPARRLTTGQTARVTELIPMFGGHITPKRSPSGAIVYTDSSGKTPVDRGTDEIIHVRSFSVAEDGLTGVSPITAARTFVSAGLKRHMFEERHLTNGVFPGLGIKFPPGMQEEQAGRWLDFIESKYKGSGKAGKLIGVPSNSELLPIPVSLADALFADMTRLTLEQACAMYQVPPACLLHGRQGATDDDWRHFSTFALGPVLAAMAEAFTADDDLFRPGEDDDLEAQPDADALMKLDPLKKAQTQLQQIQSGSRLVDEIRGEDGYGPLPPVPDDWQKEPGKVPQITPVGGKPNPTADTTTTDTNAPEDQGNINE